MNPPRICLALATLLAAPITVWAQNEAPITSVVLYPGSATVERSARVTPGMTQLTVRGLPANFDAQTLRVQADAGIQIGQVVTEQVGRAATSNPREAELEAKIVALQDSRAMLDVDAKSAGLVQNYLEHLNGAAAVSTERTQAVLDAKAMASVLDTIRRSGHDALAQIQHAHTQARELDKKIAALQRDLERSRSGSHDLRHLTINLSAHQAGTLRLSYQVQGAGWKPTYRASLDSAVSTIALERLATVSQKTGEDWSGVKLKLSTGQPRLSPAAPEPTPWLLSYFKPAPQAETAQFGYMAAPAPVARAVVSARRAASNAADKRAEEEDNYAPPVLETQASFSTEFEVPGKVDLPADGREISVALSQQSLKAVQRVRVAPRLDKNAVVTAEAERPPGVWLNGTVQLFRDGNYVGATMWNTQASQKLLLPFGRDELIRVTVDRAEQRSGTTGVLVHRAERKVAELVTLTSFHHQPVTLLVLDSSPVSGSDEVKVQASYVPAPTLTNWDQRQGVVGWEKSIAPNESFKLSIDYAISYPTEGSVSGLP